MLNNFMETWKKVLEDSNYVDLHYYCDPDIDFWCFEFDVENIISNLISNSLSSFEREMNAVLKKKEISLIISKTDGGLLLDYQDSGWGLIPRYKARPELILEAFESGRTIIGQDEEGTGMGMWIVNRTVSEYNGTINLNENKETEQGFYIKIELGGRNV